VDWARVPALLLDSGNIPDEVQVKGLSAAESGHLSLLGPGRTDEITLEAWRKTKRFQELEFEEGANLLHLVGIGLFLEDKLHIPVDIVPVDTIREEIRGERSNCT